MEEQIKQMYDELYKSKYAGLEKAKNDNLAEISKTEKDNANTFYDQRNQASSLHSQNTKAIRDYMANNNLLQSGESVDSLLRNNSDYSNNMGAINGSESKFKNDIAMQRNKVNTGFTSDVNAMRGEIEAGKLKDIMAYKQQQEALARSGGSGGSGGSSGGSTSFSTEANSNIRALNEDFNAFMKAGNTTGARDMLNVASEYYKAGLISAQDYQQKVQELHAYETAKRVDQVSDSKFSTGNGTNAYNYTYVNGQAVPTNKKRK